MSVSLYIPVSNILPGQKQKLSNLYFLQLSWKTPAHCTETCVRMEPLAKFTTVNPSAGELKQTLLLRRPGVINSFWELICPFNFLLIEPKKNLGHEFGCSQNGGNCRCVGEWMGDFCDTLPGDRGDTDLPGSDTRSGSSKTVIITTVAISGVLAIFVVATVCLCVSRHRNRRWMTVIDLWRVTTKCTIWPCVHTNQTNNWSEIPSHLYCEGEDTAFYFVSVIVRTEEWSHWLHLPRHLGHHTKRPWMPITSTWQNLFCLVSKFQPTHAHEDGDLLGGRGGNPASRHLQDHSCQGSAKVWFIGSQMSPSNKYAQSA